LVHSGRLVADDIVEVETTPRGLVGAAPKALFGLLEIKGAGIIDVRRVFGPSLVRRSSSIDIIVRLEQSPEALTAAPKMTESIESLMKSDIPVIHLAAGASGDAAAAAVVEHIMIEAGAEAPILDALVKER
jgi:HPr kinase/phosphorylase